MNKSLKTIGSILLIISTFSIFTCSLPIGARIASAIAAAVFKVKLPPPPPNRGIAGNRVGDTAIRNFRFFENFFRGILIDLEQLVVLHCFGGGRESR